MAEDRYARYGAASGILAVVISAVGFGLFGSDIPNTDASAREWQSFFVDHQDRIQFSMLLLSVSTFFFIWFLGSIRSAIAAVEPANRIATIAVAGGVVAAVFFVIAIATTAAAALRPEEAGPELTRALNDIALMVAAPAAAGFAALFAAVAIAGYRLSAIPAPIAGLSALAAVCQALVLGTMLTDSGTFAADGFLGLIVPTVTAIVALLALSITLVRQAGAVAAPAAQ
jgi:hypothetical protein